MNVHERVRLGMSRSFQTVHFFKDLTAFENVRIAVQACQPWRLRDVLIDAYPMRR